MAQPLPFPILTADQMRAAEQAAVAAGTSLATLMDRAGAAVAETVWRFGGGRPVLILCGPGNNGGDGYVAARLLKERGIDVRVAALRDPGTILAKAARVLWAGPVVPLADAEPAPILVDALFGTGLKRPLGTEVTGPLIRLSKAAKFRIAVDLPSGVGTDDGAVLGALPVDLTLALGALKPAHLLQPAASLCGTVKTADIGVNPASATSVITRPLLTSPGPADHKYTRGTVGVIAGDMAGAALLAAHAAQRAGAGYVMLAGAESVPGTLALVRRNVEAMLSDERIDVVVIGPGLGAHPEAEGLINRTIDSEQALVFDADALRLLTDSHFTRIARRVAPVVLTPHEGEFRRMFDDLAGSKLDRARAAAERSGCKIILKGADTVVASTDGRTAIAANQPGWLASAGTGDVLAGIVAAQLSAGLGPFDAMTAAVWLHGEAARLAGPALIADDLIRHLPAAIAGCL